MEVEEWIDGDLERSKNGVPMVGRRLIDNSGDVFSENSSKIVHEDENHGRWWRNHPIMAFGGSPGGGGGWR